MRSRIATAARPLQSVKMWGWTFDLERGSSQLGPPSLRRTPCLPLPAKTHSIYPVKHHKQQDSGTRSSALGGRWFAFSYETSRALSCSVLLEKEA